LSHPIYYSYRADNEEKFLHIVKLVTARIHTAWNKRLMHIKVMFKNKLLAHEWSKTNELAKCIIPPYGCPNFYTIGAIIWLSLGVSPWDPHHQIGLFVPVLRPNYPKCLEAVSL